MFHIKKCANSRCVSPFHLQLFKNQVDLLRAKTPSTYKKPRLSSDELIRDMCMATNVMLTSIKERKDEETKALERALKAAEYRKPDTRKTDPSNSPLDLSDWLSTTASLPARAP